MNTLTLILCFSPLYKDDPVEFCYLASKPNAVTAQEYCDWRRDANPNYTVTICREFDGSRHDKELLK